MPWNQRGSGQSVPFNDITAADPAGDDFYEYFVSAGSRPRYVLDSYVFVVIPFGYFHLVVLMVSHFVRMRNKGQDVDVNTLQARGGPLKIAMIYG
jgi:hypothetical protein